MTLGLSLIHISLSLLHLYSSNSKMKKVFMLYTIYNSHHVTSVTAKPLLVIYDLCYANCDYTYGSGVTSSDSGSTHASNPTAGKIISHF